MSIRLTIRTISPSLSIAICGDEGGNPVKKFLASVTASFSIPAKTVTRLSGIALLFFAQSTAMDNPGLALPAAHPQTEFTKINVVPSLQIHSNQMKRDPLECFCLSQHFYLKHLLAHQNINRRTSHLRFFQTKFLMEKYNLFYWQQ